MTQKSRVFSFCQKKEGYFILEEAYEALSDMKRPTIRFYLQKARDNGYITFIDNKGLYKA